MNTPIYINKKKFIQKPLNPLDCGEIWSNALWHLCTLDLQTNHLAQTQYGYVLEGPIIITCDIVIKFIILYLYCSKFECRS